MKQKEDRTWRPSFTPCLRSDTPSLSREESFATLRQNERRNDNHRHTCHLGPLVITISLAAAGERKHHFTSPSCRRLVVICRRSSLLLTEIGNGDDRFGR